MGTYVIFAIPTAKDELRNRNLFCAFTFTYSVALAISQMSADFYQVNELRMSLSMKCAVTSYFTLAAYYVIPTTHAYEQDPGQTGELEMTEMGEGVKTNRIGLETGI